LTTFRLEAIKQDLKSAPLQDGLMTQLPAGLEILKISKLHTYFFTREDIIYAVDGLDLAVG
jgi:hypothetical protein